MAVVSRRHWPWVAAILGVAAFARLYRIDLTWYFLDQVRDISTAVGIVTGRELPLLGPLIGWTSGRLGPLYFYLIAPPFAFTRDPMAGFAFAALVNVLAVFLCYRFTRSYFGREAALAASALFAVFPLAVFSSRVLWNPALVPLFTLLLMQALFALVVRGRSAAFVGVCASLAVLTQLHLSTAALGVAAAIALVIWRPRVRAVHVAAGIAIFAALYAPYLAYELGHGFENTRAILRGVGDAGTGPRALPGLVTSLAALHRPVVDGFVVADPWPLPWLAVFTAVYRAEAIAFCAGVVLAAWRLTRDLAARSPEAVAHRRAAGLLLVWLAVPVLVLGTRRTALWWYYLDLLYPAPFVLAGLALAAVPSLARESTPARRVLGWGATGLVVAAVVSQLTFQVALQRRIDRQGQLLFDVPRFSVAHASSELGVLPSLPYAYRVRLLSALLNDLDMSPEAFPGRVHGAVLGSPAENFLVLRYLAGRSDGGQPAGAPSNRHYLVEPAGAASPDLRDARFERVGPYVVVAYEPSVDYQRWRCRSSGGPADEPWEPVALPATNLAVELGGERAFACEGIVDVPAGRAALRLVVVAIARGQLQVSDAQLGGRPVRPAFERTSQSPSLYWTTEAVFDVADPPPGATTFRFSVSGMGPLIGLDVHE